MAQNAADGSIVLSLDASQVNAGLKKTGKDVKAAASQMGKDFKSSTNEQLGAAFGGTSVIASGAKAGLIGAAVAGVAMLAKNLWDAYGPLKDVNKELERGAEANRKWFDNVNSNVTIAREWIAALKDIAGTADGMRQIGTQARWIDSNVEAAARRLKSLEAQLEDLDSNTSLDAWARWITGTHETTVNGIKSQADAARQALDALKKQQEEVRRGQERIRNAETNPEAVAAVRAFTAEMQSQADALRGVSSEQARLNALRRQFNLTEDQQWAASRAAGMLAAARDAAELKKATEDAAAMVQRLAGELGIVAAVEAKTADEAALDELVKKGLDEAQAERLRQLISLKKKLNQEYKPLTGLVRGTAEEIGFQNRTAQQNADRAANARELELLRQSLAALNRIAANTAGDTPEF